MVYCTIDHQALKYSSVSSFHNLSDSQRFTAAPRNYADCLLKLARYLPHQTSSVGICSDLN